MRLYIVIYIYILFDNYINESSPICIETLSIKLLPSLFSLRVARFPWRNSRRNVIGLTQKANDTRNIIHATPGFEPGELLTLPTRHRYNSLQAWPLLPSSASPPSPLRLRQSQRKLGIVVSKLCVTTTIVRQDWAKLMKTRAGSTKKG